ncbi:MAG: NAD-dependent DNA ligase LigA [Defluviitaleaceae bacterium]|nr:NAD-dependent DNA ligase LigA [Defluviitaleaceae bacterium]
MHELITQLNAASRAYYQEDREIMSDKEYDALYDELTLLEGKTGIQLASSPTGKVGYEVVSALTKTSHDIPMLSLDKTKDVEALASFVGEHEAVLSWKLDGLALVLRYNNGQLSQAITRGNGLVGEDVTHNAKVFVNIPLSVPYKGSFSVRGEAVITFADFEAINTSINTQNEQEYKNPRNLCSGTVRQLNSEVAATRRVFFYALSAVCDVDLRAKSAQLSWLANQGFDVAEHESVTAQTVAKAVESFKAKVPTMPIATDGLVLTYNDIAYSESLGATSKFPRDSLAFKWADEISETTLVSIEWNPSRTGLINPVAIFEPVEIEGSTVSRASLHNVSILRGLALGIGDRITVYKANMIIPQVADNLTRSGTAHIPKSCPTCGGETEITVQRTHTKVASEEATTEDGEVLTCPNPMCSAKLMQSLVHFVGRNGLNIEGMSEQTLEKLLAHGLVSNFADLFTLSRHEAAILSIDGFARKLYDKLQAAIEKAKDIALPNFIYALGIRHVGLANAKLLCAHYNHDFNQIATACQDSEYQQQLAEIKGFGEAIAHSLHTYFNCPTNMEVVSATLAHLRLRAAPESSASDLPLTGLTFVITGDVHIHANRKTLQNYVESQGGKVTSSVTSKTSYLINNDSKSSSTKNKKAAQLGVHVITEEELMLISNKGYEAVFNSDNGDFSRQIFDN